MTHSTPFSRLALYLRVSGWGRRRVSETPRFGLPLFDVPSVLSLRSFSFITRLEPDFDDGLSDPGGLRVRVFVQVRLGPSLVSVLRSLTRVKFPPSTLNYSVRNFVCRSFLFFSSRRSLPFLLFSSSWKLLIHYFSSFSFNPLLFFFSSFKLRTISLLLTF